MIPRYRAEFSKRLIVVLSAFGLVLNSVLADDRSDSSMAGGPETNIKALRAQVELFRNNGDYEQAAKVQERIHGYHLSQEGETALVTGAARERLEMLRKAAALPQAVQHELGRSDAEYDRLLTLEKERRFDEAISLISARKELFAEHIGEESPSVLGMRFHRARMVAASGRLEEATNQLSELVLDYRAQFGDDHYMVASVLHRLARTIQSQARYSEAEPLYREAIAVQAKLVPVPDKYRAVYVNDLGSMLIRKGDLVRSEVVLREALALHIAAYGEMHMYTTFCMNNLAKLYYDSGQYRKAEQRFREVVAIQDRLRSERGEYVPSSLNNLGACLIKQGLLDEGTSVLRRALEQRRNQLGDRHIHVSNSLVTLGRALQSKGKGVAAAECFREAIKIARNIHGYEHPTVASILLHQGRLHHDLGDLDKSEELIRRSLAIYDEFPGSDAIEPLRWLGKVLYKTGDLTGAERYLCQAMVLMEQSRPKVIGEETVRASYAESLSLAETAGLLSQTLIRLGRYEEALAVAERGRGRALLDLLARSDQDLVAAAQAAHDTALSTAKIEEAVAAERLARTLEREAQVQLRDTRRAQNNSMAEGRATVRNAQVLLDQRRRELEDATAELMILLWHVWPAQRPATTAQIRDSLAEGELLLTYVVAEDAVALLVVPPAKGPAIRGVILADGKEGVRKLAETVDHVRDEIVQRPQEIGPPKEVASVRQELFHLLIPSPIHEAVLRADRVVIVADGFLHGLPFEVLEAQKSQQVANDETPTRLLLDCRPHFVYVDSATVYLNRREARRRQIRESIVDPHSAVVLGHPTYARTELGADGLDEDPYRARVVEGRPGGRTARRTGDHHRAEAPPGDSRKHADRGEIAADIWIHDCRSRGIEDRAAEISALEQVRLFGDRLTALPGTEAEVETIAGQFRRAGGRVDVLVGDGAHLHALEEKAPGKRFLHLATHGLAGSKKRPYDASLALARAPADATSNESFLSLDHLVREWRGKLSACELVVLSACDTQHAITRGDSVMALPWGFMYAGAPTVVASLWKVDDTATVLLMKRFYENLLGQFAESRNGFAAGTHMPKAEALRESKSWLRSLPPTTAQELIQRGGLASESVETLRGDAVYDFSHPYYWAAFVLIGEPE